MRAVRPGCLKIVVLAGCLYPPCKGGCGRAMPDKQRKAHEKDPQWKQRKDKTRECEVCDHTHCPLTGTLSLAQKDLRTARTPHIACTFLPFRVIVSFF